MLYFSRQISVSRAFKAAPRKCKQVSIPLDLHLNSDLYAEKPVCIYCSIIKYKVDLQKYLNLWSGLLKIAI